MQNDDLGVSIVKGACNSDTKDLAVELTELGLDALLDEGVLKEIPVLKTIIACRKTWITIHDQLFLRKVAGFLLACPKFTEEDKEGFAKEHLSDPKKAKRLGDSVVLVLDRLDDFQKPEFLARAFAAHVRAHISYDEFRRLAAGIESAISADLKTLASQPVTHKNFPEEFLNGLLPSGFAIMHAGATRFNAIGSEVHISKLGRLFQKCMSEE